LTGALDQKGGKTIVAAFLAATLNLHLANDLDLRLAVEAGTEKGLAGARAVGSTRFTVGPVTLSEAVRDGLM
jgi:hypothetical protein